MPTSNSSFAYPASVLLKIKALLASALPWFTVTNAFDWWMRSLSSWAVPRIRGKLVAVLTKPPSEFALSCKSVLLVVSVHWIVAFPALWTSKPTVSVPVTLSLLLDNEKLALAVIDPLAPKVASPFMSTVLAKVDTPATETLSKFVWPSTSSSTKSPSPTNVVAVTTPALPNCILLPTSTQSSMSAYGEITPVLAVTSPTASTLVTSSYVNVPPIVTLPLKVPSTAVTLPTILTPSSVVANFSLPL